jgi:hypothetical protein
VSAETKPVWVKLNQFQRMMLRWNALHPYNAVHVVRIEGVPDLDRLKSAIAVTLQTIGFEEIILNPPANPSSLTRFRSESISDCPVDISILSPDDSSALHSQIQRELNRPFLSDPRLNPFRFFVQSNAQTFWLGLTYFHPIADAESIVWLLRACVENYVCPEAITSRTSPLNPKASEGSSSGQQFSLSRSEGVRGLFLHNPLVALRRAVSIFTTTAALRRCFRPPNRNHNDFTNGFVFFSLPPESLRALVAASKSWNVTVNDIFLALLLKSVSSLASRRHTSGKRKRLGIGCIVNLRKELGFSGQPVFGLFLGSFVLTHEAPDTLSLEALSRDMNRLTAKIKKRRLALGTPVELVFGRFLFSLFSTERQKKLYQKNYPLWGGITNMNLNSIWPQQSDSSSIDYFRAVSTGPATPLVFSLTTCGERLNVGLTFRTAVFSDSDVTQIQTTFLDHIHQLETSSRK